MTASSAKFSHLEGSKLAWACWELPGLQSKLEGWRALGLHRLAQMPEDSLQVAARERCCALATSACAEATKPKSHIKAVTGTAICGTCQ